MSLKKLRKKLKKTFVFKAAKTVGRTGAKVVKYVAPVAGAILAGPLGAAAGAAVSGVASQVGPNKNRGAALKRALIYGGAVTGGAAALSVLGGTSLSTGILTSAGRIFAPGSAPPGANVESQPLGPDPFLTGTSDNNGTPGSGNTLNTLANAFLGGGGAGAPAVPGNSAGGGETRSPFGDFNLGGIGGGGEESAGGMGSVFQGRGLLIGAGVIILILVVVATAGKRRAAA